MWDKVLTIEAFYFIKNFATEEDESINNFFIELKKKDYKTVVVMATLWKTFSETKQAYVAIDYIGWFHASRFIILMDYLSTKYKKGELK
jgi:hypothetical protein